MQGPHVHREERGARRVQVATADKLIEGQAVEGGRHLLDCSPIEPEQRLSRPTGTVKQAIAEVAGRRGV
ncbi:hypothetical protein ADK98_09870, partial [Streptomyces sp. H036]